MQSAAGGEAPVRDTAAMIAGMDPVLLPGAVAFVDMTEAEARAHIGAARAMVREGQGVTLILPADHAAAPDDGLRMRQITLRIQSALDGVGLTAAVAGALADAGIPCNVVAGARHDHLFITDTDATRAVAILRALAGAQAVAGTRAGTRAGAGAGAGAEAQG